MRKRYFVTGATSGIGHAVYRRMREQGHQVVVLVRNHENAHSLAAQEYIVCDLAHPAQVENAAIAMSGTFDGFVHCAAVSLAKTCLDMPWQEIEQTCRVNIVAPMILIRHVVPRLNDGSAIVLCGSQSGFKGSYDDAYATTKGGIHSLVISLAPKLAPKHRIINLSPGITTPSRMIDQMLPEHQEKIRSQIPMQSFADASEMADIVMFLLSNQCRFMTGNTIDVNGGRVLR